MLLDSACGLAGSVAVHDLAPAKPQAEFSARRLVFGVGQLVRGQADHDGEECRDMHVRAIFDDKGKIMVIATHNCDNGDGWEREGESDFFFHEFSEKRAYPLGFNIVFYLMTH